jgi:hypothetical protein
MSRNPDRSCEFDAVSLSGIEPDFYFFVSMAKQMTPQIAPSTVMRHGSPRCAPGVDQVNMDDLA